VQLAEEEVGHLAELPRRSMHLLQVLLLLLLHLLGRLGLAHYTCAHCKYVFIFK
jgi:hypothetical protein